LWDCGDVTAKSSVVDLVDEDTEESGGLFARVWLELRLDLDNEGGGYGGEQTSLRAELAHPRRTTRKKHTKIRVVFMSSSYLSMNSRSYSSASWRYFQ